MARRHVKTCPITFTRQQIEDEIERLIGMLDAMDPDSDLEDSGDREPWLGAAEGDRYSNHGWDLSPSDEREEECEDEGAQCDDEGVLDNEDLCSFGDDLGTLHNPDKAERNRVTDSVVAVNDRLRAVMRKRGLDPVPAIINMEGSIWPPR
ncbi:MAG: hypothetical protein ACOZAM_15805 [Pseudomonadota bacterium]